MSILFSTNANSIRCLAFNAAKGEDTSHVPENRIIASPILDSVTPRISRLESVTDKTPRTYPLETILKEIQTGQTTLSNIREDLPDKTLKGITEYARSLLHKLNNPKAYTLVKGELPQNVSSGGLGRSV